MKLYQVVAPSHPTVWVSAFDLATARTLAALQLGVVRIPRGTLITEVKGGEQYIH